MGDSMKHLDRYELEIMLFIVDYEPMCSLPIVLHVAARSKLDPCLFVSVDFALKNDKPWGLVDLWWKSPLFCKNHNES